jgi:hypothetical protein
MMTSSIARDTLLILPINVFQPRENLPEGVAVVIKKCWNVFEEVIPNSFSLIKLNSIKKFINFHLNKNPFRIYFFRVH